VECTIQQGEGMNGHSRLTAPLRRQVGSRKPVRQSNVLPGVGKVSETMWALKFVNFSTPQLSANISMHLSAAHGPT
jgi:hypothetical protein